MRHCKTVKMRSFSGGDPAEVGQEMVPPYLRHGGLRKEIEKALGRPLRPLSLVRVIRIEVHAFGNEAYSAFLTFLGVNEMELARIYIASRNR